MKAWEVLKMLQEGKKMRLKDWEDDWCVKLQIDDDGYIYLEAEDCSVYDLSELLKDEDEWEVYEDKGVNKIEFDNGSVIEGLTSEDTSRCKMSEVIYEYED